MYDRKAIAEAAVKVEKMDLNFEAKGLPPSWRKQIERLFHELDKAQYILTTDEVEAELDYFVDSIVDAYELKACDNGD